MRALSVFAYTCLEEVGIWKKLEEPCNRKDHRHEQGRTLVSNPGTATVGNLRSREFVLIITAFFRQKHIHNLLIMQ